MNPLNKYSEFDAYDFVVSDIEFIIKRTTDSKWKTGLVKNQNSYIMFFDFDGNSEYTMDNTHFSVTKGDIIFFKKGEPHTVKSDSQNPWTFCNVAFNLFPLNDEAGKNLENIPTLISAKYYSEYEKLFRSLTEIWSLKTSGHKIKCRSIIYDILYRIIFENLSDNMSPHTSEMEHIDSYILKNYKDELTISKLANMVNLSESYFRRIFREYKGCSTIHYINTIRISKACELLRSGINNITEIAEAVGFNNIYYFSRMFKKYTGTVPSKFSKKRSCSKIILQLLHKEQKKINIITSHFPYIKTFKDFVFSYHPSVSKEKSCRTDSKALPQIYISDN